MTLSFPSGSHGLLLRDCLCASLAIRPFSSPLTPHSLERWGMQRWGTPASHAPAPTIFPANPPPRGVFPWRDSVSSESESHSVMSDSLQPLGVYSLWNSPGQNTGVGSLSFLWEIFLNQGSNPGLLHCGQILYQLSHQGSPRRVGSLSFLQSIFPNQELNQGLLHCRQILYQLSCQGSPRLLSKTVPK